MPDPKVSVLMPVYNGEKYLREAVESILNQIFSDFEFIIIDDGSTDNTNDIIRSYSDPRVRLVTNENNIGLTRSLNRGIDLSRSKYIARMDGDDVSLPARLEKQVEYMENHPETGVVGTRASEINHLGKITRRKTAHHISDKKMKVQLMFGTCFLHPSVMMRRRTLENTGICYDESFSTSQDYFLWWRLSSHTKFSNLSDALLHYRKHSSKLSHYATDDQSSNASRVRRLVIETMLSRRLTDKQFLFHDMLMSKPRCKSTDQLREAEKWLIHLINENEERELFEKITFRRAMGKVWLSLCQNSTKLGYILFRNYSNSELFSYYNPSIDNYFKLLSKAMLRYDNFKYQYDST